MSIVGWYYLHINGDLIYKVDHGETAADIRESDFARGMWPMNPTDRLGAWNILVESLAAGAKPSRIKELAEKWRCSDADAAIYAERVGVKLSKDGNSWCATRGDFINLQESPAGFGDTALEAMAALCKALGYEPYKMWGKGFKALLSVEVAS